MLDATTKARIDSARRILVGKVPDPKSQVEQITIALIYKFMDDMDRQAEELGDAYKYLLRVLDHVIVTKKGYYSFQESGLLD